MSTFSTRRKVGGPDGEKETDENRRKAEVLAAQPQKKQKAGSEDQRTWPLRKVDYVAI